MPQADMVAARLDLVSVSCYLVGVLFGGRRQPVDDEARRAVPEDQPRLAEKIAGQIREWILTGTYAPGDKLPSERRLATLLGVNRGSLRLALKKLEQLGLLQSRQGDGTRVRDPFQEAGIELLRYLLPGALLRNSDTLRDILDLRVLVCTYVVRLAARRARPEDVDGIRALIDKMEAAATDPVRLMQLDFDLFCAYAQAGRSIVAQLLFNTVRSLFEENADLFAPMAEPPSAVIETERAVADAVSRHNDDAAGRLVERYLREGARKTLVAAGLSTDAC